LWRTAVVVVVVGHRLPCDWRSPDFCRTVAISIGMRFTLDGESFELTPDLVRARLAGHLPEDIREYWVEIDGRHWPVKQVISLATGVSDRQRFQSQSSRRWLQNLGFTIGGGKKRSVASAPQRRPLATGESTPVARALGRPADVVLVGCVKPRSTARDRRALLSRPASGRPAAGVADLPVLRRSPRVAPVGPRGTGGWVRPRGVGLRGRPWPSGSRRSARASW